MANIGPPGFRPPEATNETSVVKGPNSSQKGGPQGAKAKAGCSFVEGGSSSGGGGSRVGLVDAYNRDQSGKAVFLSLSYNKSFSSEKVQVVQNAVAPDPPSKSRVAKMSSAASASDAKWKANQEAAR